MVSRYYYSEEDAPPTEPPDVLRSSKYAVWFQPSQVSQLSHESANSILKKAGTDGTDGTLISTQNNGDDNIPVINNGHLEGALGMPVKSALALWRSEGAAVIPLGSGEKCLNLEQLLSNPDIDPDHLEALRVWLQEHETEG